MATIIFSLIGSCLQKIQEITTEETALILGVKGELTDLQRRMKQIQCFINDAEQRSIQDSAVNNWVGELRDAMYDADNIIDLARFKGSKLLADNFSLSSRKSTACSGCSPLSCFANMQTRREIAVQIKDLNKRIEKISTDSIFLTLKNTAPTGEVSAPHWRKTSHLVELNLVGKEIIYSSRSLVDLVHAHKESKSYKLAIVGTGGVGKTTLAQKIYNDQRIKGNFKKHAWICVSQQYNEVTLLKEVLRNFGVHQEQGETIAELHSKLEETIKDKSFFLVLDDVWQFNVWTDLLRIPLDSATTGVILMTTRDDRIAMKIGVEHTHRVDLLSVEVGWELLWKSMNIDKEKEVQNLRDIGIEIVQRCGCLPLAIKVTASVLASRDQTENEWKNILSKNSWSQSKLPTEIEGALYLSYDELPHHLKQCFLYCATLPEDCIMDRNDLIMAWVAEDFVVEQKGQLLEDTAQEYYYELIHRNLLQPYGRYFDHRKCKMHDLVRQLACYLSREECFVGDPESLRVTNMSKMRRLTVVSKNDILVLPSMDKREVKVRTFRTDQQPLRVEDTFFMQFPYLRVLNLRDSLVQTIPDYIRNLIHLRLLDLDGTDISCLPESIGSLLDLQILNLQRCKDLHSLPLTITQLSNLRRLGLAGTPINQVPKGIGRLELLNDLQGFPIGGGSDNGKTQDGWKLEELGQLSRLRKLHMINLERAAPCSTDSILIDKRYLKELKLFCTDRTDEPYSEEDVSNIENIFEQLTPPHNLEGLCIGRFFGRMYPTWLSTTHLFWVKHLALVDCNSCVHLPPIGQLPNLKYLRIEGAAAVTKIGPEFLGCRAFPKLESLVINDMPNWEEWSLVEEEDGAAAETTEGGEDGSAEIRKGEALSSRLQVLPRLKKLGLEGCPKLRALPRQLGQQATNWEEWSLVEEEDGAAAETTEGGEDGSAEIRKGEALSSRLQVLPLPRLKKLGLEGCPKLRALPRQLGQQATNLKELQLRGARCLKVVEDLPFLSELLLIAGCEDLKRVSNLPQVRDLRAHDCPNLRSVEGLGCLQQLWLGKNMKQLSELWVPGLQQEHQKLHGEDVDVFTWPKN